MDNEVLRQKLMSRIDALLSKGWLVWGDDRKLLSALRGYATGMTAADLDRLQTFMTQAGATGSLPPDDEGGGDGGGGGTEQV